MQDKLHDVLNDVKIADREAAMQPAYLLTARCKNTVQCPCSAAVVLASIDMSLSAEAPPSLSCCQIVPSCHIVPQAKATKSWQVMSANKYSSVLLKKGFHFYLNCACGLCSYKAVHVLLSDASHAFCSHLGLRD